MRISWLLTFILGCAASYGPAPLEPERPIAELSEDEWQALCRWVNSRRPERPRGFQPCRPLNRESASDDDDIGFYEFEEFGDFCELRDRVSAETVGELAEVVECHSQWRERRAEYFEGMSSGCGCEAPGRDRGTPRVCPLQACELLPSVFAFGMGECFDGTPACPHECGCECNGYARACRD